MRRSRFFVKTFKEAPQDEESKNAQLLIRAGYIHKEMAGVYDFLPLGFAVLQNIISVIREEMNSLGALELQMSSLQRKDLWEKTDRWSDEVVDVWFKTRLQNGSELGLAFTHEEPVTDMLRKHISSYRDLPVLVYQFQRKFRNEVRAKSGIMRTREFIMKDLYSFAKNEEEHKNIYEKVSEAYLRIYKKLGLGDITYKTFASGGVFSKYSHEFQALTQAGEDIIYISKEKGIAVNEEVLNEEVLSELGLSKDELEPHKASELGNIFSLGSKYSDALGLLFKDEDGDSKSVIMGSYGIGPARVMGVIVETLSDEKGIVWPKNIAPFDIYLISHEKDDEADVMYERLVSEGFKVLYDDRKEGLGAKLKDWELLGIPYYVLASERASKEGGFEVKSRAGEKEARILSEEETLRFLKTEYES